MSSACDETSRLTPRFNEAGLITAIAQDAETREILMVAYMNEEALQETVRTGRAVYYSRSRQKLWRKGEESGNWQEVREIRVDCDQDCLLLLVQQKGGAACHTGRKACFYRRLKSGSMEELEFLDQNRLFDPAIVYKKKT